MSIRILLTGDIHLGKRSTAVGGDYMLSTKYTWNKIVSYALDNSIDVLVLTGDIVDRDNRFFEAAAPLQQGLKELDNKGIAVYLVAGNHDFDVLQSIVRLDEFSHLSLLGQKGGWESCEYTNKEQETIQFIGWSFPKQVYKSDPLDLLDASLINKQMPTLAIVHGDLDSDGYAPMREERLKRVEGVDAWLLGHIHKPSLRNAVNPVIVYPGSPHALSPKEQGVHGPFLLTVDRGEIDLRQLPLSPVRYEQLTIDITGVEGKDSFRSSIYTQLSEHCKAFCEEGEFSFLSIDLLLTGYVTNVSTLRDYEEELTTDFELPVRCRVSIRKVEFDVLPSIDLASLVEDPSYLGVLAEAILALEKGEETPFTKRLKADCMKRYLLVAQSNTYAPLHQEAVDGGSILDTLFTRYALDECKRLINELYARKSTN